MTNKTASNLTYLICLVFLFYQISRSKGGKIPETTPPYYLEVNDSGYDIYFKDSRARHLEYGDNPTLDSLIDSDNN